MEPGMEAPHVNVEMKYLIVKLKKEQTSYLTSANSNHKK